MTNTAKESEQAKRALEEAKKRPSRAPNIGGDTISILESLDFDQSYIKALLNAEVIFSGATED